MSIYKIPAKEMVYYDFYVRADSEEEAINILYEVDTNLSEHISDGDGFEIDYSVGIQDLGNAEYLPEFTKIINANKKDSSEVESFLLTLTRTRTKDLEKMFDKETDSWKKDLIEHQINENLFEIAYLFIRENLSPETIKMALKMTKDEQRFFFVLYADSKEKNLYPDILVDALQEFDI